MPFITRRTLPAATLFVALANAQTCYYPDGKTVSKDIPCDSSALISSCCSSDSFCLADGLCYSGGIVARGSCTDKSWTNGVCAKYCQKDDADAEIAITPCTSGGSSNTFVCGVNTTDCQTDSNTFSLSSDTGLILRPNQVAALVGSALGTAAPSQAAARVTVTATPDSGVYSGGQMAGLALGIALPLLLAIGVLFTLLRKEKRRFSKPKLMYKLPDEVKEDDHSLEPPPPIPQSPAFDSHRVSHVSAVTTSATSRRASLRTLGTLASSRPALSQTFPNNNSSTFLERYETMKKNAQVEDKELEGGRHELDSAPMKEPPRYELAENRMSH